MRIWTWVHREEEAVWFEVVIEIGPRNAWLESNVHISRSESNDFIHFCHGNSNTITRRDTLSNVRQSRVCCVGTPQSTFLPSKE